MARRDTFSGSFTDQWGSETADQLAAALVVLTAQVERCRRPGWRRKQETLGVAVLQGILKDVQRGSTLLEAIGAPARARSSTVERSRVPVDGRVTGRSESV